MFDDEAQNEIGFRPEVPPWYEATSEEKEQVQDGQVSDDLAARIITRAFELLREEFPGYQTRDAQIQMSIEVLDALLKGESLALEAGTGIGKSFAYSVGAIAYSYLTGERVLISTETKNLQMQLIEKDLPVLKKILDNHLACELALGSSNYLCRVRFEDAINSGRFLDTISEKQLEKFRGWTDSVFNGKSFGSQYDAPLNGKNSFWSMVSRDSDMCPAQRCPSFEGCNYYRAKESWERARVIVGNHHLLLYHMLNDKRTLPAYGGLIIDEAHGFLKTGFHIFTLAYHRDALRDMHKSASKRIASASEFPGEVIADYEDMMKRCEEKWDSFFSFYEVELGLSFAENELKIIEKERSYDMAPLLESLNALADFLADLHENAEDPVLKNFLNGMVKGLHRMIRFAHSYKKMNFETTVYWAEKNTSGLTLHSCNLLLSEELADLLTETSIWTSATLGYWPHQRPPDSIATLVKKGYFHTFIKENIPGVKSPDEIRQKLFFSPFNYSQQAALYIPSSLEMPAYGSSGGEQELYEEKLMNEIEYLVELSGGGALVLFTSNYMLRMATDILYERLDLPVYSQAESGPNAALKFFLEDKDAVLLGTTSFWQGVDIPGEALRMLIITKLMFTPPNDPIYKARSGLLEKQNKKPFFDLALPTASMMLRQAFGRLIRKESDKGVVAILDNRLLKKSYGKTLLANLPPVPLLTERDKLKRLAAERGLFPSMEKKENE